MRISDWSSDVCSSDLPEDDRYGADDVRTIERNASQGAEELLDGVQRAGADVAINHAEGTERQRRATGFSQGTGRVLLRVRPRRKCGVGQHQRRGPEAVWSPVMQHLDDGRAWIIVPCI